MSTYTAVVIPVPEDGKVTVRKVEIDKADQGSLRFMQAYVGGYIEHVASEDGKTDFWFNEEGKLHGLPINPVATELLYELYPAFRGHDLLVGPVIVTGNRAPNTANVPAATWELIKRMEFPHTRNAGISVEIEEEYSDA